jgi:hypothetical protein
METIISKLTIPKSKPKGKYYFDSQFRNFLWTIGGGFGHPLGSMGWPSHPLVPKGVATVFFLYIYIYLEKITNLIR